MAGPEGVPAPLSKTDCGLSPVLSLMVRAPVRVPVVVGVKTTPILQDAPAPRDPDAGQVVPCGETAKSPLAVMLEMFSTSLPTLVRTTVCAVLGVLTA